MAGLFFTTRPSEVGAKRAAHRVDSIIAGRGTERLGSRIDAPQHMDAPGRVGVSPIRVSPLTR
jgi:hypothetical protein